MKYALSIALVLLLFGCHSNENASQKIKSPPQINNDSIECNDAILEANADIKAGKLGYRFVGFCTPPFHDSLKLKYGINVIDEGCVAKGGEECYDSIMRIAIIRKFGKDIIQIAEHYGYNDPEFPGGEKELSKFLDSHIKYGAEEGDSTRGNVIISFIVTASGKIIDITIVKGLTPAIDSECLAVFRKMPRWVPATYLGKKIDLKVSQAIDFKEK